MKNKIVAALLAIFLGNFGIHKFYIGNPNAWKYLLFGCILPGVTGVVSFFQGIKYLLMSDKDFDLLVMKQSGWMGKRMVENIKINDQFNDYNNKYANDKYASQSIKYELTGEFYNKLNMFSLDVMAVINVLKTNSILLKECSNNPEKISDCMCYDMVQIFGMLYGASFDIAKLESFACFMLLPNANSDLIRSKSYQELADNFQTKKYEQAIKDTISHYINYDNPFFLLSDNNSLALPNILKKIDSKLFEYYANMLNNYAKFLSLVNGLASIDEQKSLTQIYHLIYS